MEREEEETRRVKYYGEEREGRCAGNGLSEKDV